MTKPTNEEEQENEDQDDEEAMTFWDAFAEKAPLTVCAEALDAMSDHMLVDHRLCKSCYLMLMAVAERLRRLTFEPKHLKRARTKRMRKYRRDADKTALKTLLDLEKFMPKGKPN
jgi:hypothetical protein